ncbi:MAG: hypothetical protein WB562_06340 [Candidatus Sulfotelmatobacter sp.]
MTTAAEQNLTLARLHLQAAEEAAAKDKCETAKRNLIDARTAGRRLEKEIAGAMAKFRQAKAAGEQLATRRQQIDYDILNLKVTAEFPTEEELQECETERERLKQAHAALLVECQDAANRYEGCRSEVARLDAQLTRLRYTVRNLETLAHGGRPGTIEGSVRTVAGGLRVV